MQVATFQICTLGGTSWFSWNAAVLLFSLSQQPRTGNQQMENKLYICLEDMCFSPALTELFLFIYVPPSEGKCFVQRLEAILLLLKQNPEQPMDSWRAGCGVELWDAQSQIFTWSTVRWFPWPGETKLTYISSCFLSISSNDLSFLPCISDPSKLPNPVQ